MNLFTRNSPYYYLLKYSVIQKDGLSRQFEQIFAQTGDSNYKCTSLLNVECWMLKRRRNARWSAVAGSVLMNSGTQKSCVA